MWRNGRRSRLKICRANTRAGSSPAIRIGTFFGTSFFVSCFEAFSVFLETIRFLLGSDDLPVKFHAVAGH